MPQRRAIGDSSQDSHQYSHQHSHQHSYQRRCVARIVTLPPPFNDSCSHECIFLALCKIEMPIVAGSLCEVEVSLKQAHQLHAYESTDRFTGRQSDVNRQIIALTKDVIVAGSLVARECMIRFTGGQNDEKIDHRIDSVIEAGSLIDLLIEEIDFELVIVADSLVARERMIRFTDEQDDESEQAIALTMPLKQAH